MSIRVIAAIGILLLSGLILGGASKVAMAQQCPVGYHLCGSYCCPD